MRRYVVENFESIAHLLYANETRQPNHVFNGHTLDSNKKDSEFSKTKTYDEAASILKNGFEDVLEDIKRGVAMNSRGGLMNRDLIKNDIVGYAPCVPNAILGLPKSMINKEIHPKKSKVISVLYDCTASWMVNTETFIKAGVVLLSMVNALELAGYRVAIRVLFTNSICGTERACASLVVKDWKQPLDLKKVTFPLCHPAMLRRVGFRWLETTPGLRECGFTCGYGSPITTQDRHEDICKELKEKHIMGDQDVFLYPVFCQEREYDVGIIMKDIGL